MILIIASALFSVSAFVLWPSVVSGRPASNTPEQVVDAFYQEYLASIGRTQKRSFPQSANRTILPGKRSAHPQLQGARRWIAG